MSAARLSFIGNAFFRFRSKTFLRPPPLRPPSFVSFRPVRGYSTAVDSVVDDCVGEGSDELEPWPEWVSFVGKLKEKGYFGEDEDGSEGDGHEGSDFNRLKTACLSFARERRDIMRSLPKEEIKAVVESGCPNLLRKVVNSSKRLRNFVKLDEGEVCAACNLRDSCDRAYLIQDDEVALTVDLMRVLMSFAFEPAPSNAFKYNDGGTVAPAARKLLAALTERCDSAIDPSSKSDATMFGNKKVKADEPKNYESVSSNVEFKKGDWICSKCNFMNFARNIRCRRCREDGPKTVSFNQMKMKDGDWNCPECQFMNFARNKECIRCHELQPERLLQPGEWLCPNCDYVNFKRNVSCLKCSIERPKVDTDQNEDHTWRRPKMPKEARYG